MLQFVRIVTPRHHVEVGPDGSQPETVRLIQILVDPLLVDLVSARVAGKRLHIAGLFLKLPQVLGAVVQKQILVVDMVA